MIIIGNLEIMDTIDDVVNEKKVSKESILSTIEEAMGEVAASQYGLSDNVVCKINRKTGEMDLYRKMNVVDSVENDDYELSLVDALFHNPDITVGEEMLEPIPPIKSERAIASTVRDIITNKIRAAEKEIEYDEYIKRVGEIVIGSVKKISPRGIMIAIGKSEAIMKVQGRIPGERFNIGDKITACIENVERNDLDAQIILSRSSNTFLKKLFEAEVQEIQEGLIEIKVVVRDPGSRAKVAVFSRDDRTDPVGACIGPRGTRVKAVMKEIKGEKIDVIEWKRDMKAFISNLMVPAKVQQVNLGEDVVEVVVKSSDLSLAIGKRGQNVRLTSYAINKKVDIVSEEERQVKSTERFNKASQEICEKLNLEEIVAQLLVADGFYTVRGIAEAEPERIAKIEGFDTDIATQIIERATNAVAEARSSEHRNLVVDPEMFDLPHLTKDMISVLSRNEIKTVKDFADLSYDEVMEIFGNRFNIPKENLDEAIMIARKYIYNI